MINGEENIFETGKEALNINRILEDRLKDFNNAKVSELGTGLLKKLSEGDFKLAEDLTQNFYEDSYDY
jgi:hypothetical protein